MIVVCISDTHHRTRGLTVPEGDVLVHAGDCTEDGSYHQAEAFLGWFASQPHALKVFIAGNHDFVLQQRPEAIQALLQAHPGVTYLQDSGTEFGGLRFWGAPWSSPMHEDMGDATWAFGRRRGARIAEAWARIPEGLDVLVTHCPPHRILDRTVEGRRVGCGALARRVKVLRPRLHVFGHIHFSYGTTVQDGTTFANASTCNEAYQPLNPPIVVDLPLRPVGNGRAGRMP